MLRLASFLVLVTAVCTSHAQRIVEEEILDRDQLQRQWRTMLASPEVQPFRQQAILRGFTASRIARSAWGFRGTLVSEQGGKEDVAFCLYELDSGDPRSHATLIRASRGKHAYLSIAYYPAGKSLGEPEEWIAAKGDAPVRTNGWVSCFVKTLADWCGTGCTLSLDPCDAAHTETTLKGFVACAATTCGSCVLISAILCAK